MLGISKNDQYYVEKILKDNKFLLTHTQGMTKEALEKNEVLVDSVLFRFIQISENIKRLTDEFKNKHTEIPWISVIGLRNRIVHDYGEIKLEIIHHTLHNDLVNLNEIFKNSLY